MQRRWSLAAAGIALVAIPAVVMAASLGAVANRNKVSLPANHVRNVGSVHCGLVGTRWLPGQLVRGPATTSGHRWFISRAQQAANYKLAARYAHPASRARALLKAAARFHALAVAGTRPRHACATLRLPVSRPITTIVPMPSGTIPGWTQVFADDFNGSVPVGSFPAAAAGLWYAYGDGTPDTRSKGQYWPSKTVSESSGNLNVNVHTAGSIPMGAALLPTVPGAPGSEHGQTYGRYTFRFKVDAVPGYKTAILLWPDSENMTADGEIDFPEFDWTGTLWGHFHRRATCSTCWGDYANASTKVKASSGWHIATITWLPGSLTYTLDGTTRLVVRDTPGNAVVPNTPMHMVIQTETQTTTTTLPPANASGSLRIDWLVISKPA
jgi:hypothetical protein